MKTVVAILIVAGVTWWAFGGLDWRRKDQPKGGFCFSCGGPAWRCPVPGGTQMLCKICGKGWGYKPMTSAMIRSTNRLLRQAGCKPGNPAKRIVQTGKIIVTEPKGKR